MSTATLIEPTQAMPTKPKPATNHSIPKRDTLDRIILTGFMGSGKTTAGALLAERLGWRFLDLDREIETRHQRTVPQIFAENGEAHFRHLESSTLASLLGERRLVLALGGGAPEELGNRLLLEQTPHTAVVYLCANFDTLVARCAVQATDPSATARPNLADLNLAERRFRLRRPHYERIAAHTIHTTDLSLDQTVEAVLAAIKSPR
ncbi:shikimate kinase [Granulicella sp. L46]|uniref:shikimate kinase n=1 Tax=Granulicella sp. L46 TaxID=1641865 RepID=UPI00131D1F41|nr:shikimate kinase [Granulicella sp. L46]